MSLDMLTFLDVWAVDRSKNVRLTCRTFTLFVGIHCFLLILINLIRFHCFLLVNLIRLHAHYKAIFGPARVNYIN